MPSEL